MSAERYVVLGLARPRAPWFTEISRWATAATLPVEFVKCLTADEARARLASGRRWSAFLVDAGAHGVDRDLLRTASAAGATPLVVADPHRDRRWEELGAAGVLSADFERDQLLLALAEHARPVARTAPAPVESHEPSPPPWRGRLVAVTGGGGTGTSTVAAMLAHGCGSDVRDQGLVLLADLALRADQAVIHDAGDVLPGVPELVEAHRLGRLEPEDVRDLAFHGGRERPYDLLLGLRRPQDWTALRPRAVEVSLDALRAAYRTVVADVDGHVEGEAETGSPDVEERHVLARAAVRAADAVVVTGRSDVVGVHRLATLCRELRGVGVPAERLLPVVNQAPRSPRARAELTGAVSALAGSALEGIAAPIFIGTRRRLDESVRAGGSWPTSIARQLAAAVDAIIQRPAEDEPPLLPERVVPGSLGSYSDLESDVS